MRGGTSSGAGRQRCIGERNRRPGGGWSCWGGVEDALTRKRGDGWSKEAGVCALDVYGFGNAS